jgi:hypothetical protein
MKAVCIFNDMAAVDFSDFKKQTFCVHFCFVSALLRCCTVWRVTKTDYCTTDFHVLFTNSNTRLTKY